MNLKPSDQTLEGRTRKGSATSLSSLGEQLRLAREARGVALRTISEQTRIQMRYLEAIEANDYKQLPGGIFNRSFIKAYAKAVGFDETEALAVYAGTTHEDRGGNVAGGSDIASEPAVFHRPSPVYTDGEKERSPFLSMLIIIAIVAILSLGIYAVLHRYQKQRDERSVQTPPSDTTNNSIVTQPSPMPGVATNNLQIQITARAQPVWIRARVDDGETTQMTLAPNEEVRFTPLRRLSIQYSRSNAAALQVMINGRPARVPNGANSQRNAVEMVIDENFEQLLQ